MRVLIENEAGSRRKNTYDERTLQLVSTADVSAAYPFAYGFVIGTRAEDGDAADCFVLTGRRLTAGTETECDPIALIEQIEDGEVDHKIIAAPVGEKATVDDNAVEAIRDFAMNVFKHVPGKQMTIGQLLGADAARAYLHKCAAR
jgi:inorganic pyrophosphatase